MKNDIELDEEFQNNIMEQEYLIKNLNYYIDKTINKSNNNIQIYNNIEILKSFIDNSNTISSDEKKLESFINELIYQLKLGNNILIPFLDICPNLLKAYIDNNLDEEGELKYIEVFKLLKINSFISREYLYPIYEYFSDLFYNINDIENNPNLKKFNKVLELWKLFYDFEINMDELKFFNSSSYCFIGGGLKISLSNEIKLNNNILTIKINFLKSIDYNLNENLILFRSEKNLKASINFSSISNEIKEKENIILLIIISHKEIRIKIKENENSKEFYDSHFPNDLGEIKDFILLDNFYGQIKRLEFIQTQIGKDEKNEIIVNDEISEPYPLTDNGFLCHHLNNKTNLTENNINSNISIKAISTNLIKANYINYIDKNFNLINYFCGISSFIPFIQIINGIYINNKIKTINGNDRKDYMKNVLDDILFLFFKTLMYSEKFFENKKELLIRNYNIFVFSLLLQIDYEIYNNNEETRQLNSLSKREYLFKFVNSYDDEGGINSYIFGKLINKNQNEFENIIKSDPDAFIRYLKSLSKVKKTYLLKKKTCSQFYRSIMKELFIYNRFWSRKELFFSQDNKSGLKLKYKQLSYYTKNFQQPLLYPILNFNDYLPSFSRFDKNRLFKHDLDKTINYNFKYKDNVLNEIIENCDLLNKEKRKIRCCLVKKSYHVKGEITIIKSKSGGSDFQIVFYSDSKKSKNTCNKIININQKVPTKNEIINYNNDQICYGSIFPCLEKEYNRKILIKSKDIKFLLIRNYYRKTSAIEIFTYKSNKSYYFNFENFINIDENSTNIVLKAIQCSEKFQKFKFDNDIVAFFNVDYGETMFPLFSEKLYKWEKKLLFYNNYDILTIINLLSNRSFKDLYQYPIFPILYKMPNNTNINERDLGQHIGLLELTEKSLTRKMIIEESYNGNDALNDGDSNDDDDDNEACLFNTHYSNCVYTCNFLIRIFPFSLPSIEFQGDGFDSPNRLFYSIKKTLENTLTQKSDLREMIPEMYYFPDLFDNKNELRFGNLLNGTEINNVSVNKYKEDKKEKFTFICYMKKYLESGKLKINNWINLIFGINQKETNEKIKRHYYSSSMYINKDEEKQNKDINNSLKMQKFEFGIQPYKLMSTKFPEIKDKSKYSKEIKRYSMKIFKKEHIEIYGDKEKCFKYEGYNNIYVEYIKLIDKKDFNKNENNKNFYYIFQGDVLGNIQIYKYVIKRTIVKTHKEEKDNNIIDKKEDGKIKDIKNDDLNTENEYELKLIKTLTDHYKQIKYIDYNPRLNLFVSYSLDGFINLYVFPKCKLVRAIKVKNITNSNHILKKLALISNPFPMIFTYDKINMYTISLNGELITKEPLINKDVEVYPCVDKNCGLINDCIFIKDSNENIKGKTKELNDNLKTMNEYTLPFLKIQSDL